MDPKQLVEAMRTQRKRWVDVAPGKKVQILLPTEMEVIKHFMKPAEEAGKVQLAADFAEVRDFTVDWVGFTEADLLGAAIGASDAVPFSRELWGEMVGDHLDWHRTVARALLDGLVERSKARDVDAKN